MLSRAPDRAAYDQTLRDGARPAPARPSVAPRPGAAPPSFGDRLVDPRLAPVERSGHRGWRWVSVASILVAAALIVTVTAYASHGHPSTGASTTSSSGPGAGGYQVGACVAVTPGPAAYVVPCDEPHSGTVAATTDYPRPCPSGTETVALVAENLTLCLTSS